jgi:hypothetical protein
MITKTLRVAIIRNDNQGVSPGPPQPSARLPRNTSKAICGLPMQYPSLHHYRYGRIASDSAIISATKFMGPHKSRMRQYITNACSPGPT